MTWPPAVTTTTTARRRAHALRRSGVEGDRPLVERWVGGLSLDVDVRLVARSLPPALVVTVSTAALVGGPGLTLTVISGGAAAAWWLAQGSDGRRAKALDRDLPIVLEAVARHLRAGDSLTQAIVAVSPNPQGALGDTWARLRADLEVVGAVSALDRWACGRGDGATVRPSERLAATALALAAETGGSPARAVDGVAATLRTRRALGEEIRALSSQARASAAVIALAPLVFGSLAAATDDRTSSFFRSPIGLVLLAMGLGLDVIGAWWMARLCRMPTT